MLDCRARGQAQFELIKTEIDAFEALIMPVVAGATLLGLLLGVGAAVYVGTRYVSNPLTRVTQTMARIAEGDFSAEVPYAGEKNEIGQMAAAVQVFKENGIRVAEMNEDERTRHEKAAERAAREAEERAAREAARLAGEPTDEDRDAGDEERSRDEDDEDEGEDRSPEGE